MSGSLFAKYGLFNVHIDYSEVRDWTIAKSNKLYSAIEKAERKALAKSAYRIFRDAQQSIKRSKGSSQPGTPPHTRRGMLRKAIRYRIDYTVPFAVIGPVGSGVGPIGELHEFGGRRGKATFPARPFMGPALIRETPRFTGEFVGSI